MKKTNEQNYWMPIRMGSRVMIRSGWFLFVAFLFFCMCPFLFPLPFMSTNLQPYAAVFGAVILVMYFSQTIKSMERVRWFLLVAGCAFAATMIFLFGDISTYAFRGFFNHASVFIVPLAAYVMLDKSQCAPERIIKCGILLWFWVATIQFLGYRGFMTGLIGGVNWSSTSRGVVGLASEPSFFGIACFYFLLLAQRFQQNSLRYIILITVMGTLYAQSFMGIFFIALFYVVYWLEHANSSKGIGILIAVVLTAVIGWLLLERFGSNTRLYKLLDKAFTEGFFEMIQGDQSATNRYNALINAVKKSFSNYLIPQGYARRIGSGYGGLMIETGIFGLVECIFVSTGLCLSFSKGIARVVSFVLFTILLFMNTQIGNPLLLMVVGFNYWEKMRGKKNG